jgi:uncharacterized protein
VIYLDSCALVKLIRTERESEALQEWLDERAALPMVTSGVAQAEVPRVIRRNNHTERGELIDSAGLAAELAEAHDVLDAVDQVAVDHAILTRAGAIEQPMVRTLDAIHLVSALELDAPELEFVTYDRALARAAGHLGLRVSAPR